MKKYINPNIKISIYPEEKIAGILDILSILGEEAGEASGEANDSWEEEEW